MHQHGTERTKELKRRRQRRKECLKEKIVNITTLPVLQPPINVSPNVSSIPQNTQSIFRLVGYSQEFISFINNDLPNVTAKKYGLIFPKSSEPKSLVKQIS